MISTGTDGEPSSKDLICPLLGLGLSTEETDTQEYYNLKIIKV